MLFSDDNVAGLINDRFEAVWMSVRPVPIVRIDFGNGNVLTRTLHGNIATYVLRADGQIVDVLPGIYETEAYMDNLEQLWWLSRYSDRASNTLTFLRDYHEKQANLLDQGERAGRVRSNLDIAKLSKEMTVERILNAEGVSEPLDLAGRELIEHPDFARSDALKSWSRLSDDTKLNERQRRLQIHRLLATDSPTRPQAVTRKIYRDVLHADLDDPYLGLGDELFGGYPFREDLPKAIKASAIAR